MAAKDRITPQEWDKLTPALQSMKMSTFQAVREVLVDGKSGVEVGAKYGISRQAVNAAVARVRKILEENDLTVLEPVTVWLPPEKAAEVRAMAKLYESARK